ncbi:unnamed protein product, partial [Meganyctiphanes norvegica]
SCLAPWTEYDGKYCFLFSSMLGITHTWWDAQEYCHAHGWLNDLAVIRRDLEEYLIIADFMHTHSLNEMWVGASDLTSNKQWLWTDNTLVELTSPIWECGAPSSSTWRNCGALSSFTNATWLSGFDRKHLQDQDCERELFFVCQKDVHGSE